jgi:hypothetical protein
MIKFGTETGSVYLYDADKGTLARVLVGDKADPLRRDGDTLKVLQPATIRLGHPAVFVLEPLAIDAKNTIRTTSHVTWVKTVKKGF